MKALVALALRTRFRSNDLAFRVGTSYRATRLLRIVLKGEACASGIVLSRRSV